MTDIRTCPVSEVHRFLGARPIDSAATAFSVWAPAVQQVTVDIVDGPQGIFLKSGSDGYHHGAIQGVVAGDRYYYRLDGGPQRPDPASRFQPDGVHGASQVVDSAFAWTDQHWCPPGRDELIIYELHLGTFTEAGTFSAAIKRIAELVELGVTAIELMPVAASAGRWNWGYDGVALFAPLAAYGTPDDFRRFVNAAHAVGIAVLLDVVYNHLGPEGNYLHEFGPYLSSRHQTVWGDAPNFDCPTHGDSVRRWFIANALYWLDEFHLDGLRVDAIHCMADDRDPHIAAEISDAVTEWSQQSNRTAMLIAESNVYDPEMIVPRSQQGIGFDAMWCDDFLHSTFAILRPGEHLSNRIYHPGRDLDQTLRYGYVYEGTLRKSRERRALEQRVETHGLIHSIQNHDFIGNHPLGVRLHQLTSDHAHRAAAALMILSPAIPMLFMGEEYACEQPFRFFVDFSDPRLRQAVVEGRRREYPQHDWDDGILPTDPAAFQSAKIGDSGSGNPQTLQWYRSLIGLRKSSRGSGLLCDANLNFESNLSANQFTLHYQQGAESLVVVVRLSPTSRRVASRRDESIDDAVELAEQGDLVLDSRGTGDGRRLFANHALVFRN